jgi:hypothetical protein
MKKKHKKRHENRTVVIVAASILCYVVYSFWKMIHGADVAASTHIVFALPSQSASGTTSENYETEVTWDDLRGLDYLTGSISEKVTDLNRHIVRIPGYMVPLTDNLEYFSEFLIVPGQMACIHAPPPAPNQMLYVKATKNIPLGLVGYPFWFEGELHINPVKSSYGLVTYSLMLHKLSALNPPTGQ